MKRELIDATLKEAFRLSQSDASDSKRDEFVFHLTDCVDDLERYVALLKDPTKYSPSDAKTILDDLLLHAAGHIAQAARLYGGFIDSFASGKGD